MLKPPPGVRANKLTRPAASCGMNPRRISPTPGFESIISAAKHAPMVATRVMMKASMRRMPRRESASRMRTSSAVITTPQRSGTPNKSLRPIAAPSTSARSHATIAISHSTHKG